MQRKKEKNPKQPRPSCLNINHWKLREGLCVLCLRNVGQDHTLRKLQVLCNVHRGALHNERCFPADWNGSGLQIWPRVGFPKSKIGKDWAGWLPRGLCHKTGECNLKAEHSWKRSNNLNSSVWKIITHWQVSRAKKDRERERETRPLLTLHGFHNQSVVI